MPAIAPGARLSHFEVLEKLGEGGMGVVYKARDLRLDRPVAIKVLPEQAVASADRQARFEQEAKAASALNHPNIITVYEIDRAGDATFIAMEYVDGRTLDHVIARKGLRFPEALKYAVQITDALAAAHGIGIVHRDLKPANIMITGKGLVKVLDFGLAKLTHCATAHSGASDGDATVTMQSDAGQLVGTTAYMSPEQAQAQPIDARSDIFSFGVVLYEMLTGRRPFAGDTKLSTRNAIVNEEPTSVKEIVEGLPPELDRIIARCLRKDPARRFQTMADLHVTLEELKEESDSGRIAPAAPLQRPRRRAWPWAAAAALVVLAALGVWQSKRFATPAPPQRVVPVTTYTGVQRQPCFSPDGNQVAFSWDGEKGDNFDIYVKLLGETNALRLTTDPAADAYPAWSPDGKRIAFERSGPNGGIYLTSPLGGAEQKLTDFTASGQMSWSPDGKWLAVSSLKPEMIGTFLLPIDGGEPRRISNRKAPAFDLDPSIFRDGHLLAYAACTGSWSSAVYSCDFYVQNLDSAYAPQSGPRRVTNQALGSVIRGLAWSGDGESLIADGSLASSVNYLWRLGIHGQRAPQRIELAGPKAISPSIASTGKHLVFSRLLQDYDIWRYHIGGGMEPLIVSSLTDGNPQFSPDGNKIAFASDRSGDAMEIWLARFLCVYQFRTSNF
jgi:Tol biopolymer transport system component/predicted Ser/Thr protein kinase